MRPCLNPGQMNPPGGTRSPAAWRTPSQPVSVRPFSPRYAYFLTLSFADLTFTSPIKVHPSYALCHTVSHTSSTAFALTCVLSHVSICTYRLVRGVLHPFWGNPNHASLRLRPFNSTALWFNIQSVWWCDLCVTVMSEDNKYSKWSLNFMFCIESDSRPSLTFSISISSIFNPISAITQK